MKRFLTFLRTLARRVVMTREELGLLAERDEIMRDLKFLGKSQVRLAKKDRVARTIVAAVMAPQRYLPDEPLTAKECEAWEGILVSPVGVKIDTAMINFCQQQAQAACAVAADQLPHAAGVARGCLIGWQMAKTLSRIANAQDGDTETDPTTAQAGLAQHQP
jgi:hypothetical protein